MLSVSDLPVESIAGAVGYGRSHFSRAPQIVTEARF